MANREIDYYVKNLPFDVRQEIFKKLKNINPIIVDSILEKYQDYPSLRRRGLKEEDISDLLDKSSKEFESANSIMLENERYPLFNNSKDTYQSCVEYVDLLKKRDEKELIEKFGCNWSEYIPKKYEKKTNEFKER